MGSSLKILAVDDEPSIVQSMFFIFERPMYEVDSAEDGEAALACVEANPNPYLAEGEDLAWAAEEAGYEYPDFIEKIAEMALSRHASRG